MVGRKGKPEMKTKHAKSHCLYSVGSAGRQKLAEQRQWPYAGFVLDLSGAPVEQVVGGLAVVLVGAPGRAAAAIDAVAGRGNGFA